MSAKKQTFGQPKPLPGQAGYNTSEIDSLEKDATDMEGRLKMLQERMLQQQRADEAVLKPGGSRWGSARADKGSVKTYAKDVQEKHKKRAAVLSDPAARATAEGRRQARAAAEAVASNDFRNKDVGDWTVGDVTQWLDSVMLGQYAATFAANEIYGPILLDISLEDLDYMGVSILGHRKVVLKGIEDLRQNKRVTLSLSASNGSGAAAASSAIKSSYDDSVAGGEAKASAAAAAATKLHWSQLEPLSSNKLDPSKAGGSFVNGADNDIFDEAAEQAAFRDAVAEWRGSGGGGKGVAAGSISIVREWEQAADKDHEEGVTADSKMWRNPFAGAAVDDTEASSSYANQAAVAGAASPRTITNASSSLAEGALDEAAEHAEFVKAVEAWRGRGNKTEQQSTSSVTGGSSSSGAASTGTASASASASSSAMAIAKKIAQQLETEQVELERRVQLRRDEAEQKLATAVRAADEARSHKYDQKNDEDVKRGYDSSDDGKEQYSASAHSNRLFLEEPPTSSRRAFVEDIDGDEQAPADCKEIPSVSYIPQAKSTVEVSLVESTLGLPDYKLSDEKESYYVVEEDSSGED